MTVTWTLDPQAIAILSIASVTIFHLIKRRQQQQDWRFPNEIGGLGANKEQNDSTKECVIPTPVEIDRSRNCFGLYVHDNIGDDGAKEVATWIKNGQTMRHITEIDLYANQIGPEGAKSLGYALASPLPRIAETFLLDRIQVECTAMVASFSRSLESLTLDHNRLGDRGAQLLAKGLKDHPCLAVLSLCDNGIGNQGASALVELVLRTCGALRVLRLSNNDIVGKQPMQKLTEVLSNKACTLEGLFLDGNGICFQGAKALASMLRTNSYLKDLNLRSCSIGTNGAIEIAHALTTNQSLRTLYLEGNDIAEDGARAFIKAMETNKNLQNLKLQRDLAEN